MNILHQICQNTLNLGHCKRRGPLRPKYVEADSSIAERNHYEMREYCLYEIPVDIWVVDSRCECEFWGLKVL